MQNEYTSECREQNQRVAVSVQQSSQAVERRLCGEVRFCSEDGEIVTNRLQK